MSASTLRQCATLLRREASLELAGREALATAAPFVAGALVLAGLALGPDPRLLEQVAPGVVWLVVLFTAVLLARLAGAADRDDDAWDLLRSLARPTALLTAKAAALWCALAAAWALAALLAAVLLGALPDAAAALGGLLGTLGVATVTAVLGALLAAGARHATVLAALLLPAALPALLAGTQAWVAAQPVPWLWLLVAYDAVVAVAAWAVFPTVLED